MKDELFKLKNLYTAHTAKGDTKEVKRLDTIVCRALEDETLFQDIITGTIYKNNTFDPKDKGRVVVFFAEPLCTRIKSAELKDRILRKGYVTIEDAIEIYEDINNITVIKPKPTPLPEHTTLLNEKTYDQEPALYRTAELEQLMISLALNKKIVLLTGPANCGKTALIDELAYLHQQQKLPEFLQDKEIIEINIAALKKPKTELIGIIDYAKKNKAILFVDGIIKIQPDNQSYIDILMNEVERNGLKLIIATSDPNLNQNLQHNSLRNKFDIIELKELSLEQTRTIAKKAFTIQSEARKLSLTTIQNDLDDIITILLECTSFQDINALNSTKKDYNPGFVLSIIETICATAQAKSKTEINHQDVIKAIQNDPRINKKQKTEATNILQSFVTPVPKPKVFTKFFNEQKTK